MGFLVGDQIDNKTEAHVAMSVRIAAWGLGLGALIGGVGFGVGVFLWGISRLG